MHRTPLRMSACSLTAAALLLAASEPAPPADKKGRAAPPPALAKTAKSKDFAVGLLDAGKLQHAVANDGRLGTLWDWNREIYLGLPGAFFKGYGYVADLSMMIGVPEGPWTPKYKNPTGSDSLSMGPTVTESFNSGDWEPRALSYGRLHSGALTAKQIVSHGSPPTYPVMATSTLPETWPEGHFDSTGAWVSTPGIRHWPGPWAVGPGPDGIARTPDDSVLVGRFTGDKEVFFSMNDFDLNDQNIPSASAGGGNQGYPLRVEFDIHAISYGRSFAEDFIFFPMKIVYTGKDTLSGVYLGFYLDVDAPEWNASGTINHREDWVAFTRSEYEADLDSTIDYNMAYIYDQLSGGIGPYTGPGPVAYTAIKLLETPTATEDIDLDGNGQPDIRAGSQLGITDWHWFRWENRPGVIKPQYREWEQYKLLSGGSKTTLWDPAAKSWGKFRVSQGGYVAADTLSDGRVIRLESVHTVPDAWFHPDPSGRLNPHFDDFTSIGKSVVDLDAVFIMSCGPFTLKPGDRTTFSFALIMGESYKDLKLNARTAQIMYNLNYLGANAPDPPSVTAVPGDGRVTLYWDDAPEKSKDILTGYQDFEGYKIYRTTVHPSNNKWGDEIRDGQGTVVGFVPVAQCDLGNSIAGLDPVYPYLNRGSNSGLLHSFVDSTVDNGRTYWYSVTAYDRGISAQNDPALNPDGWADLNYLENAKGNNPAQTPNLVEVVPGRPPLGYTPPAAAGVTPNPDSLGKGTVTPQLVNPAEATASHTYTVTFDDTSSRGSLFYSVRDEKGTLLVDRSPHVAGSDGGPVFHGVRLRIANNPSTTFRDGRWTAVSRDTSNYAIGPLTAPADTVPGDYLLEIYDRGRTGEVGARVFNVTRDPGRTAAVLDTALRVSLDTAYYELAFLEPAAPAPPRRSWSTFVSWGTRQIPIDTVISGRDTVIRYRSIRPTPPSIGDRYLFRTNKPTTSRDSYAFAVAGSSQATSVTEQQLGAIRVVPNPYIVTAAWELSPTQKQLAFTNLPPTCTIEIFTVTGELVRRIERSNAAEGWEWWNLLNTSNRMVAYGLYVYAVTLPDGTKSIGKFAVIR